MVTETKGVFVQPAEVVTVNSRNRTVDVKFLGIESGAKDVVVLFGSGDYTMPKEGEYGLILVADNWEYYLGKLEYNYANKVDGKTRDPYSGERLIAKAVRGGEIFISNLAKRIRLNLSNTGNFSLMNGFQEGLKYVRKNRILQLAGMTVKMLTGGTNLGFGSVLRDLPGQGPTVLTEGTTPYTEGYIEVLKNAVRVAKLHLGDVKETTLGADEVGSYGGRLRALIQTYAGDVPLAKFGIDESGNIEVASSPGKTMVDGTEIQLGGLSAAEQVIKGNTYTSAENTFLTSLSTLLDNMTAYFTSVSTATLPIAPAAASLLPQIAAAKASLETFKSSLSSTLSPKTKTV